MLKKKGVVCVLVIAAVLSGCFAAGSPASAVRGYYKALENLDVKALARVTTPETARNLSPWGEKAQGHVKSLGRIKTVTEAINGDTAVVAVTFETGTEEEIRVKKVNGKWLVSEWD